MDFGGFVLLSKENFSLFLLPSIIGGVVQSNIKQLNNLREEINDFNEIRTFRTTSKRNPK